MAYNEKLADRIRKALSHVRNVKEKKMFGGLAFIVDNKMCITAGADRIMRRIDPAIHEEVIKRKACRTVIMRGIVRGWTNNEYPAIANTFSLVASFWEHFELRTDHRKQA